MKAVLKANFLTKGYNMNIVVVDGKAYPYTPNGIIMINTNELNKLTESQKKTFQAAQAHLSLQVIHSKHEKNITHSYNTRK